MDHPLTVVVLACLGRDGPRKGVQSGLHVCSSARDAPRKIDPAASCGLPFSCLFGVKSTYHKIPQKDLVNHHFLSRLFNVCFSIFLGFRIRKISETISRSIRQWPDSRVVAMLHQRVGVPSAKGSRFHVFFSQNAFKISRCQKSWEWFAKNIARWAVANLEAAKRSSTHSDAGSKSFVHSAGS